MDDSTVEYQAIKQELISDHNEKLRQRSSMTRRMPYQIIRTPMGEMDMKPSGREIPLDQLLTIHCSSLAPGTVHHGRVLRGTLIVEPLVMNAVHTVIEDEVGNVARLSIYNFVPQDMNRFQSDLVANSLFKLGKKVAVIEPYYKFAASGSLIVRVDNFAQDVIFLDHLGPRCSQGWRNEGKALYGKQYFIEAIHCYSRSIHIHTNSKIAAVLLSNIATALLIKEDLVRSLLFAVVSFVVDDSIFRPYYTAGFILNKLNRNSLALNCLEQCRKLKAPIILRQQLVFGLGNSEKERTTASRWNAEILSIVAAENVRHLLEITSDSEVNSLLLKEKGNDLFKKKEYDECIRGYCMALRGVSDIAMLLSNRAICHARLGNYVEAALHASAAICINPVLAKAHYWKSFSLLHLDHKREALKCCKSALAILGECGELENLRARIKRSLSEKDEELQPQGDLEETRSERSQKEWLLKDAAPASCVAMTNQMIEFLNPSGVGQGSMLSHDWLRVDKRVSPFHLEFSREGKWPALCDTDSSMHLLISAYEHARAPPPFQGLIAVNQTSLDIKDVAKRLHSAVPNVVQWWFTAPSGSLSPKTRHPYERFIHHSFTNAPCRENIMSLGTVHVSVGFVDLNQLLLSRIVSSKKNDGPLLWIGFESSAYSVAKTMVISQMLFRQADTNDILQVWYSSSWTQRALRSFRAALKDIMDNAKESNMSQCSKQVVALWRHWQQFDVSLRTARSEWLARHNLHNHTEIANFRRKMDRIALCRYLVSGEVLEGTVGSIVMFGLPKNKDWGRHEISLDEWFLHCLPTHKILKKVDNETNVIDAAIQILQKRISQLKELLFTRAVQIEVRHKSVTPDNEATLLEIRKLSPQSMSWSNLCDYVSNEKFHKMTRACSEEETIHYLYSMNWSVEVKGAHLMDYQAGEQEKLLHASKRSVSESYRVTGVSKYLHDPPITHPYNLATFSLGIGTHELWTDNFFRAANLEDRENQVGPIEPQPFDILGHTSNVICMVYSFNQNIRHTRD